MIESDLNPDPNNFYHHRTLVKNRVPIFRRIEHPRVVETPTLTRRILQNTTKGLIYAFPLAGFALALTIIESMPKPQSYFNISSDCSDNNTQRVKIRNSGWNSPDGVTVRINETEQFYSEENPVPEKTVIEIYNPKTNEQISTQITVGQPLNLFGWRSYGSIIKQETFPNCTKEEA